MPDYEKMYHKAFNALTDAERLTQQANALTHQAKMLIQEAQQQCEALYVAEEKEPDA